MEQPTDAVRVCITDPLHKCTPGWPHVNCGWHVPWTPDADRGGFDELRAAVEAWDRKEPFAAGNLIRTARALLAAHPATGDGRRCPTCGARAGESAGSDVTITSGPPYPECRNLFHNAAISPDTAPPATGERTEAGDEQPAPSDLGPWCCYADEVGVYDGGVCTADNPIHSDAYCGYDNVRRGLVPAPASHDGRTGDEDEGDEFDPDCCQDPQSCGAACRNLDGSRWIPPARPAGDGQETRSGGGS